MPPYFYGFSQNPGQPPPQQPTSQQNPYPYQQQQSTSYASPALNPAPHDQQYPPYTPGTSEGNFTASQASYDYNASRIPGLGITGTPTAPTSSPFTAPPGITLWASGGNLQPSTLAGSVPPGQDRAGSHAASTTRPSQTPASQPQAPPAAALAQPPVANTNPPVDEIEEGELSEGQFEDLYEPKEPLEPVRPLQPAKQTTQASEVTSSALRTRSASVGDDVEPDLYGDGEEEGEEGEITTEQDSTETGQIQSDSYSPFLTAAAVRANAPPTTATVNLVPLAFSPQSNRTPQQLPGLGLQSATQLNASSHGMPPSEPAKAPQTPSSGSTKSPGSFAQARKEAQEAVLRLWPLGVKYQNYIDEGIQPSVIREIFTDLHLNIVTKEDTNGTQTSQNESSSNVSSTSNLQSSGSAKTQGQTSSLTEKPDKTEARNERIARLLAEQQAKKAAAAASGTTKPVLPPKPKEPSSAPATPSKPKSASDKNLLLQQKMAALKKKQQESRAVQSPRPQDGKNSSLLSSQQGAMGELGSKPGADAQLSTHPATGHHTEAHVKQPLEAALPGSQPADQTVLPIPSLIPSLASPGPQTAPMNGRKRPVAADFDDYSATVGPLKRPFGQERAETTLVIDVSDGSDEDEDEDMEMETDDDSPVDASSSHKAGARKGLAIRDFPPLTDTPSRPFSSPGSSNSNRLHVKKRRTELELKEQAIQQMKQRIAQAEAQAKQKASKTSSGSQTPDQYATTPDPKESDPALPQLRRAVSTNSSHVQTPGDPSSSKLPKMTQFMRLRDQARIERRGRIMSLDLPRVDSALQENIDRLNELRNEEARLHAEIERSMAEKKILTDELARLETDPVQQTAGETEKDQGVAPDLSTSSDEASSGDISMETESPQEQSGNPQAGHASTHPSAPRFLHNQTDMREVDSNADSPAPGSLDVAEQGAPTQDPGAVADGEEQADEEAMMEESSSSDESSNLSEPDESPTSDGADATDQESASASTDAVELGPSDHVEAGGDLATNESSRGAGQISSVTAPREAAQELEAAVPGESGKEQAAGPGSTFVPYKSPLEYFRAYRFHPGYRSAVAGGLKSLTYSNKINPRQEMCPYELDGQPCPEGDACEFQHFRSVAAADDHILLELGNADGYEDKARFIKGLRELLQNFRAKKVKDFGAIAQGIIDYRAEFLGDKSKVLNLDGVVL
ncbi:hypothetical protein GQ53DRAFT_335735 [Thozetella sp. PMI_491]|nr:hypothetical protein GQ53DRAFT_335735 [Thozetella sp. PMI_491]